MTPTPIKDAVASEVRARLARLRPPPAHETYAEALGITRSAFSRKLAGTNPFHLDEVHVVAGMLGTTAAELIAAAEKYAADQAAFTATREDPR